MNTPAKARTPCTDQELGELVCYYMADELSAEKMPAMMAHIKKCESCRNFYGNWERLKESCLWEKSEYTRLHTVSPRRVAAWDLSKREKIHVWNCVFCLPHIPRWKKIGHWLNQNKLMIMAIAFGAAAILYAARQ